MFGRKRLYKFGFLRDPSQGDEDEPYVYPDLWDVEPTAGPERLIIAPSRGHVDLLLDLARCLAEPFMVLYVLLSPRRDHERGRYQSPAPLGRDALRSFFKTFRDYFESDGRHHVWIKSWEGEGTLVYDHHNVIYAYGPLEGYEEVVQRRGLRRGKVSFPAPHAHHFHAHCDESEDRLFSRWAWIRFPLGEQDEDR